MKISTQLACFLTYLFFFGSMAAYAQDKLSFIVAQDGTGDYITIQNAIDACKSFPDSRITIFIRNGTYKEKVVVPAINTNLSIIGESVEKTIVSFGDYFDKINRGRNSTFFTYTFLVESDDFYAENLTIENSAGRVGQAVALHITGDRCVFRNCRILGNQDTLFADGQKSRQYFEDCYIEGTTDFIFGGATVLFERCIIFSKANSFITAASTSQGKLYGFVFIGCRLLADDSVKRVFLGRPWRDYARVVFIDCELGKHILPEGWSNWSGTSRDKTAFFAESGNKGPGADYSRRVKWSHQLSGEEAANYTDKNILSSVIFYEKPVLQWINKQH
jgi:pectinesterase